MLSSGNNSWTVGPGEARRDGGDWLDKSKTSERAIEAPAFTVDCKAAGACEISAARRAQGGYRPPGNFRREEPPRHYGPDDLGGLCDECGNPLPAALAGLTTHPTCDPDWPPMHAALERALRRRRLNLTPTEGATP